MFFSVTMGTGLKISTATIKKRRLKLINIIFEILFISKIFDVGVNIHFSDFQISSNLETTETE